MKKLIAAVLLLACVFMLAACGKKEEKKITLGFSTNSLTNETMSFMTAVMQKYCDEQGFNFMLAQNGGDTATCQNDLENMVAGGCDGIVFMNFDVTGIAPVAQQLHDKGIALVAYDEYSDIADYSWMCSNYDLGYAIGKMAAEWANDALADQDEIWMGEIAGEINEYMMNRSNGIQDGFEENCPKGKVFRQAASPGNDVVDVWYNMLSANPQLQILCSITDDLVIGICEAWYADLVGNGEDLSRYGVFATDATDIGLNLIKQSTLGKAVFRGTIDLGLKDVIPLGMIKCLHAAVEKKPCEYDKVNYYVIKPVTGKNIDDYSQFLD